MKRTSFALIAVFTTALPAYAQVYKCVDGGRTIYSQTPCPTGASSTAISRGAPSGAAPGAEKSGAPSTAEQEQAFRKRQQEQQAEAKKEGEKLAQTKERQENCASARAQLAQYTAGGRIRRLDEKGEPYFLEDSQIASEKARAEQRIAQWCK